MTGNTYRDGGILCFQTGALLEVALASAEGLTVEGHFGDQMFHTFTGGRRRCAPPILTQKKSQSSPPPDPAKCAKTLTFLHAQDHVGIPAEHGTRTPLETARRPRKALGDFDLSICQPRQRRKCMHVPSLASDYVSVPRDLVASGTAAGEEV